VIKSGGKKKKNQKKKVGGGGVSPFELWTKGAEKRVGVAVGGEQKRQMRKMKDTGKQMKRRRNNMKKGQMEKKTLVKETGVIVGNGWKGRGRGKANGAPETGNDQKNAPPKKETQVQSEKKRGHRKRKKKKAGR